MHGCDGAPPDGPWQVLSLRSDGIFAPVETEARLMNVEWVMAAKEKGGLIQIRKPRKHIRMVSI